MGTLSPDLITNYLCSDGNLVESNQLKRSHRSSFASKALAQHNPNSVTMKLSALQLSQPKDTTGFSSYRFSEAMSATLPYAPEFLRIPEYLEDIHEYLLTNEVSSRITESHWSQLPATERGVSMLPIALYSRRNSSVDLTFCSTPQSVQDGVLF